MDEGDQNKVDDLYKVMDYIIVIVAVPISMIASFMICFSGGGLELHKCYGYLASMAGFILSSFGCLSLAAFFIGIAVFLLIMRSSRSRL